MSDEPLPDHAAERQADKMRGLDVERIENAKRIARQLFDRIGAGRDDALAMPAGIVAHDAEMACQLWQLRFPHVEGGAQGIREQQRGRLGRPVDDDVEAFLPDPNQRHARSPRWQECPVCA